MNRNVNILMGNSHGESERGLSPGHRAISYSQSCSCSRYNESAVEGDNEDKVTLGDDKDSINTIKISPGLGDD